MGKNKKYRIEKRKRAREKKEIEQLDQSRPENWGVANDYTLSKLRKHPFERWVKEKFLTQDHVHAAGRISTGFLAEYMTTMAKTSRWEKIDGARKRNYTNYQLECIREYSDWVDEMTRYRLSYRPVIDMAVFELRARELDRKHNKRNGWSKDIVREGLEIFIKMRVRRRAA